MNFRFWQLKLKNSVLNSAPIDTVVKHRTTHQVTSAKLTFQAYQCLNLMKR
jgi:hypothetical protein